MLSNRPLLQRAQSAGTASCEVRRCREQKARSFLANYYLDFRKSWACTSQTILPYSVSTNHYMGVPGLKKHSLIFNHGPDSGTSDVDNRLPSSRFNRFKVDIAVVSATTPPFINDIIQEFAIYNHIW